MSDFIIVGGGTAGCILAARLSADPSAQVTLLEAGGPDSHFWYRMPAGVLRLMKSGMGNWAYETVAQAGLGGRTMYYPRGKVLGGSSSINAMGYVRGNPGDFDDWAEEGNRGWSYRECLPYFKKLETFSEGASEYRGGSGPIGVVQGPPIADMAPSARALMQAAKQAGYPHTPDINGAQQEGFGRANSNIAAGRRQSTSATYLRMAADRPNLRVITHALVTRVIIQNGRAVGVEYLRRGKKQSLETRGEVILSGGAVNSPQLLQLSGIGPAKALSDLGIAVQHDLPGVGENLQDHLLIGLKQEITKPYSSLRYLGPIRAATAIAQYLLLGTGPTASVGAQVQAFIKTKPELERPDVQYQFSNLIHEDHGRKIIRKEGFAILANGTRPRSRGRVLIASADPTTPPLIDPNYLSDPDDLRVLRDAIRVARTLVAQPAFDDFRGPEYEPGVNAQSDADLDAYIRKTGLTVYHPVGTCRMGSDALAVVDDRLNVHGVSGLRVVDASIFPTIVSGNTNAATMMVAERASDFIVSPSPSPSPSESRVRLEATAV